MAFRAFAILAVAITPLLGGAAGDNLDYQSSESDPLKDLDEAIIGAAIANACDASFDWKKRSQGADALGRRAREEIFNQLQATNPNDPDNEAKAGRVFQLRSVEMFHKGERSVAEKGCSDPEIQDRLRRFEAESP